MKYLVLLTPMIVTYLFSYVLNMAGAYQAWYPVSPMMHAVGGFVTAWTVWQLCVLFVMPKVLKRLPDWTIHISLLGAVLTIGILWEWHEFLLDVWLYSGHILGVGDTLIDLTMDGVGALVYSITRQRVDKS